MGVRRKPLGGTDAGDFSETSTCGSSRTAMVQSQPAWTFKPAATGARRNAFEHQRRSGHAERTTQQNRQVGGRFGKRRWLIRFDAVWATRIAWQNLTAAGPALRLPE